MRRFNSRHATLALVAVALTVTGNRTARAQLVGPAPMTMQVSESSQRLEIVANSSRILSLGEAIPRAQVNNPDILELTPLSPTQVQVFAKKPGVTQVNLWNARDEVRSVDVIVYGDARELTMLLQTQFPTASLKVVPLAHSVVVSGYVERPDQVSRVVRIAEDFYPKVINNINVGGVQQVLLHVKVMEVSRTKMRALGFDWSIKNGSDFLVSSVSGLLSGAGVPLGGDTVRFGIVDNNTNFLGALEALRQNNVAKILAEPTLVTVSGRAARFVAGGEFPILVPAGLGTVSIEYKTFGTVVDFVPIVLGNGRIRLEVRPTVSELDESRGVTINNTTVPGLNVRQVDTGVEMSAGQTLALAGLIQNRVEAENRGLPILADLPYLGVPFRRVEETNNEIELLIMVTPELVEAMDAEEVPPLGPGMHTVSPPDCDLYWRGHIEVPNRNLPPGYHPPLGAHGQPACQPPAYHHDPLPAAPQPTPPSGEAEVPQASRSVPIRGAGEGRGPLRTGSPVAPVRWTAPAVANRESSHHHTQVGIPPAAGPGSLTPQFLGQVGYDVHP